MKKAVIFDLDGTLLDTLPDIVRCVNASLAHFGLQKIDKEQMRRHIGHGAKELIRNCAGLDKADPKLNDLLAYYNELYTNNPVRDTEMFKGIKNTLDQLKSRGYTLVILTNKPQATTDRVVEKFFPAGYFAEIVGQSSRVICKPDKTETLNILSRLQIEMQNAYFVGDGDTDVLTAINAGITGIAVLWGYRNKDELCQAGACRFVNSPEELLDILK